MAKGTWQRLETDDAAMEYWNPKIERLSAEELKQLQERKLRRVVENAFEYSSFYKKRFGLAGISPNDVRSLEDIQKLPFTHKTDLRDTCDRHVLGATEPDRAISRFKRHYVHEQLPVSLGDIARSDLYE